MTQKSECPGLMAPDDPGAHSPPVAALRRTRALRRRAFLDALIVTGVAVTLGWFADGPANAIMLIISTISIGMLFFIIRRHNDLRAVARITRWHDEQVAGKSLSLARWHAGETLPPWRERSGRGKF